MSEQQKVKHTRARKVFVGRRAGGSAATSARPSLGHVPTVADLARLDAARAAIMRGRRFQIDSADLLHEARREAGRE
jgi:hypothetical protein